MSNLIDLTGNKFGKLTVVGRAEDYVQGSGRRRVMWHCLCECGNTKDISSDNLKSGRVLSCGCIKTEMMSAKMSTHKQTDTPLYHVWCAMKARCTNPKSTYYKNYGGRGICVCEEWLHSFETFRDWAYSSGYDASAGDRECTLDRIDVNGNYTPENCRWVTGVAQANNRRSNRVYSYNGETHNVTEWAHIAGINPKTLFNRLYTGWDFERAITTK